MTIATRPPRIDRVTRRWMLDASDDLAASVGCRFNPAAGERVCHFIEQFCRLSKGRWAGKPLELLDWQRSFLMRLFGWRRADGRRRFRRAYVEIAKKSGKSSLMSAVALYMLLADGEGAPEVYLNACDRDQASIIFDEAARMLEASPSLLRKADVIHSRKMIVAGHGRLVANSAEAPKQDGLNPSATFFDELHRQPDRDLWDVFTYASAAREQPLLIAVTTAGADVEGVWHEMREYSEKVSDGTVADWTHLGLIYRALPEDDIDDPATWRKANPALGTIASADDFRRELTEAKLNPAALANFKRLRLNIVGSKLALFVDPVKWHACGGSWLHGPDDGEPCYMGLDLSQNEDLTALVILTGDFAAGFDVECRFWLPEGPIVDLEHRHGQPYREWADMGLITLVGREQIDEDAIIAQVAGVARGRNLRMLLLDPWNQRRVGPALKDDHGLPVELLPQGYASLNGPTKALAGLIADGKLRHRGNPILRWHASNAVAAMDPAGNLKLDKSARRRKIDGMAALVNAVAGAMAGARDARPSVYETEGLMIL